MSLLYSIVTSPIGTITLATDGDYLRELHIEGDRYFQKIPDDWTCTSHPLLLRAEKEIAHYFNDQSFSFTVPFKTKGTEFQERVWHELQRIPIGHSVTYAELASSIGKPRAVRAVGTAVGKNPLCIIIPCHRVLSSSGGLGGYVAGLPKKRYLLKHEGYDIPFVDPSL